MVSLEIPYRANNKSAFINTITAALCKKTVEVVRHFNILFFDLVARLGRPARLELIQGNIDLTYLMSIILNYCECLQICLILDAKKSLRALER